MPKGIRRWKEDLTSFNMTLHGITMNHSSAIDSQLLRGLLDTLVMRVLREGPNYGLGIQSALEEDFGHHAEVVKVASLYPLLHRLEARGLLASHAEPGDRGMPRRYYRITRSGVAFLEQRLRGWGAIADLLGKLALSAPAGDSTTSPTT